MDENKSVDAWLSFAFVSPPPISDDNNKNLLRGV